MNKLSKAVLGIFIVFLSLALVNASYSAVMHAIYPLRYAEYIEKYSEEYNLDRHFVMAIIKAESNYIYDAHSGYAGGLMQITDETGRWICEQLGDDFESSNIKNPEKNIEMGCYYLSYLIMLYNNDTNLVLAAYNAGPGNVNKWLLNPQFSTDGKNISYIPYEETREYVERVKKYTETYRRLYPTGVS